MTHIAKDEALKLALEALKIARDQIVDPEYAPIGWSVSRLDEVLENGKQALAAPVQEGRDWSLLEATQESLREHMAEIKRLKEAQPAPVQEPYCYHDGRNIVDKQFASHSDVFPLYTTPPAARSAWVGLTPEEVKYEWEAWRASLPRYAGFAKGIEAKLREKNGG